MYQYTTEKITLTINGINFTQVDEFRVAIKGKDTQILKTYERGDSSWDYVNESKGTIRVVLSQTQTKDLGKGYCEIQVRTVNNTTHAVFATNKVKELVDNVLDEEVITWA